MRLLSTCMLLLAVCFAQAVRADEPLPTGENHPCKPIIAACKAAGFKKGARAEKKGLFADCLRPILEGQKVPGVTAADADVAACKAKMGERRKEKAPQ